MSRNARTARRKKVPYIDIEFLDMEIYIILITGTMRSSETSNIVTPKTCHNHIHKPEEKKPGYIGLSVLSGRDSQNVLAIFSANFVDFKPQIRVKRFIMQINAFPKKIQILTYKLFLKMFFFSNYLKNYNASICDITLKPF